MDRGTGTAPTSYLKIAGVVGIILAVILLAILCMGLAGLIAGR